MNETINFETLAGNGKVRNLSGKARGIAAREELSLDKLDENNKEITFVIPNYIDTISPSYFQGLFSKSIISLKGKDGFLRKYHFDASENIKGWIELGIRNSTSSREPLI